MTDAPRTEFDEHGGNALRESITAKSAWLAGQDVTPNGRIRGRDAMDRPASGVSRETPEPRSPLGEGAPAPVGNPTPEPERTGPRPDPSQGAQGDGIAAPDESVAARIRRIASQHNA